MESLKTQKPEPGSAHHRLPVAPDHAAEADAIQDESLLASLQRMIAHPGEASAARMLRLQRSLGNRAVGRAVNRRTSVSASTFSRLIARKPDVVQRALLAKLAAEPAYHDGLTLATIKSSALDKPPRPKKDGADWTGKANAAARKVFKDVLGITDQSLFDANLGDARLLQPGEIHGNQPYQNKSGDLPSTTTYKEYDIAKYAGDPKLRGGERVVAGADGKNYYTANHYTDFAEF